MTSSRCFGYEEHNPEIPIGSTPVQNRPAARPRQRSQRTVRVGSEGLVSPFKAGRVRGVIRIEADVGLFTGDGLGLHPVHDHCKLGCAIAILSGNRRGDVMIDRRCLRGHCVRPQQSGHVRHIKGIGGTGDDDPVSVGAIGINPVQCGPKDIPCQCATGKTC